MDKEDFIEAGKTTLPPHDPSGWFDNLPGATYTCTTGEGGEPPFNLFTDLEIAIIKDSLPVAEFPEATTWTARRHLMFRLLMDEDFRNSRTELSTFYTNWYNQPEGQFARIEAGMYNLLDLNEQESLQLNTDRESFEALLVLRSAIDSNIREEILFGNPISGLLVQRQLLNNQIQVIVLNIQTQIDSSKNDLFYDAITQLAQENNVINASEDYEVNEQKVNEIYFTALLSDDWELSSDDSLTLLAIAEQCAYAGGDAVWKARALYKLIAGDVEFEDDSLCMGSPPYRLGKEWKESN